MITKRDQDILNFIQDFHIATSNQIHRLFFSLTSPRYTRRRLKYLVDEGHIKRARSTIDNSYAYYTERKPQQLHHDLIRAELYTHIQREYTLLEWTNEAPVDNIRPDALCYIDSHGIIFPVLIEVHLSNSFNFDKYKIDFLPIFGIMPRVVVCTDRNISIPRTNVKFRIVNFDMTGLDRILK